MDRTDIPFIIALFALILIFYSALVLRPGSIFYPFEDSVSQNFYYENYVRVSINKTGRFPLWDNVIFSGMPFYGRVNLPIYYDLPLLIIILGFVIWWDSRVKKC